MNDLILGEETLWQGSVFRVNRQRVRSRDGRHFFRELIHRDDGVAIVPIQSDGTVLMIKEYATGAGKELLFIPGGMTSAKTETHRQREAQRELREEVGLRANRLVKLWQVFEAPSIVDRRLYIYLGLDLVPEPLPLDDDEEIEVVPLPLDDAIAAVSAADGSSASILGALVLARQYMASH